jgi:CubicO group peptidase (beta-lactamase class C family)
MKGLISSLLIFLLALLSTQVVVGQPRAKDAEFKQAAVQQIDRIAREDGFSGTVTIARDGVPILIIAEGFQDRQQQLPTRTATPFPVESVTKQFTAAAILLLKEQGRLKLSDPISRYYPDMPVSLPPITIAHLLTHSSGIVDCKPCFGTNFQGYKGVVARSLQARLAFQPGAGMLYSNAGYGLLAITIEKLSGVSYARFLQQYFFSPLRMSDSGAGREPQMMAKGYFCPNGQDTCREGIGAHLEDAAGFNGVYSTVGDVLKWTLALSKEAPLSGQSRQEMFQDYGHGYGFGWYLSKKMGRRLIWHTGLDSPAGYASIVDMFPDDHVTVIALTNNTGLSHGTASLTIDGKDVTIPASPVREVVDNVERMYFDAFPSNTNLENVGERDRSGEKTN